MTTVIRCYYCYIGGNYMGKSVKEVSSLSGVSEKTVRRYLHDNNLQNQLTTNSQGGYIIPDEIAEDIRKQYENKILAKDQLNNHRRSQLKNARDIIFKSLVERDLRGSNPKVEKQMLWLLMMMFDKIDDANTNLDNIDSTLDLINMDTSDISDIVNSLDNIEEFLTSTQSKSKKVKCISAKSNANQLEFKVNKWLKENKIKAKKIDFQMASQTNNSGKVEIVYTALITYQTEE